MGSSHSLIKPAPESDAALAVLLEIRDELRAIRTAIEERPGPQVKTLKAEDHRALAALLPVFKEQFVGPFGAWLPVDVAKLQSAEGKNLRLVLGDRTARQLGKLLARSAGIDVAGLQIVRAGQDGNGALWECVESANPIHSHTVDEHGRR
jgi:hypothetical protein